ncbi:MAG: zinc ABC transporter substrate-binding protein [FCB group bacterium]|nr:zinc ABC transporter substrate-binding protein [FCB group bacterium]
MNLYRCLLLLLLILPAWAEGKVKVVTSTSDLAYLVETIGRDRVDVSAIASPKADIHFVEVRPSYMMKVAKADLVFKVGLELDVWMDRIIDGSRSDRLLVFDCSKYVRPLEIPAFKADARHGDLHRFGNPHYWMGPDNVGPITDAIVEGLAAADPEHAESYAKNQAEYLDQFKREIEAIRQLAEPLRDKEIIYYHNSWPYFNEFTDLKPAGFIESYPGVPPSPAHIKKLQQLIGSRGIKVIAMEPYFDQRVPRKLADATGVKLITLFPSIGGRLKKETYVDWLRGNVNSLLEALK